MIKLRQQAVRLACCSQPGLRTWAIAVVAPFGVIVGPTRCFWRAAYAGPVPNALCGRLASGGCSTAPCVSQPRRVWQYRLRVVWLSSAAMSDTTAGGQIMDPMSDGTTLAGPFAAQGNHAFEMHASANDSDAHPSTIFYCATHASGHSDTPLILRVSARHSPGAV